MSFPVLEVSFALTTAPTATPSWTDVTAYVQSIQIRRGRDNEFGPMGMGTCTLLLDNSDRRFDPSYAAGPYFGNLKPMRRMRVRATWGGTGYDVFYGYVDGWPQTWDDGVIPHVRVRACDGFKVLGMYEVNASFAAEASGTRVENVLDSINWGISADWLLDSATRSQLGETTYLSPSDGRIIDGDGSTLQAQTIANQNALQYLNDVTESEFGLFFVDRSGLLNFHSRRHSAGSASVATFDDAAAGIHYSDYSLDYDDRYVYNDVRMTRLGGIQQTASDTTSQSDYFIRTLQNDRLLLNADTDVSGRASYLLGLYKDPRYRAPSLDLDGYGDDSQMTQILAREIGDVVTVTRRPQGGVAITIDYRIEGIEHEMGPGQVWHTTFRLSTHITGAYWLVCGTAGDEYSAYAVLGTTTRVGYTGWW